MKPPTTPVEASADQLDVFSVGRSVRGPGGRSALLSTVLEVEPEKKPGGHNALSVEERLKDAARRVALRLEMPERDPFAPKLIDLPAILRAKLAAVHESGGLNSDFGLFERGPDRLGKLDIGALKSLSAPLVTTRVEFHPLSKSLELRKLRALVRNRVRSLFPMNSNLRKCGERRYRGGVELRGKSVERDGKQSTAGTVSGVVRCASVWSCPKCAPRISSVRARIVKTVVQAHREATATAEFPEGAVDMLTLTVPHDNGNPCRKLRAAVAEAWQEMQRGKGWKLLKKRLGFVGSIKAMEVTHGKNGWHPHLHVLLAHHSPWTVEQRAELEDAFYSRWIACVALVSSLRVPSREHGCKLTASHQDDYIAKLGLADELLGAINKTGRGGNRSPFQIMAEYANGRNDDDAALIVEHMRGMKGARQLTWSRGKSGETDLRQIYRAHLEEPTPEQPDLGDDYLRAFESDLELVQREDRDGALVRVLPGRQWDALVRVMRKVGGDAESETQLAIESGGSEAVGAMLAAARRLCARLAVKDPRLRQWLPYLDAIGTPDFVPYSLRTPRKRGAPLHSLKT